MAINNKTMKNILFSILILSSLSLFGQTYYKELETIHVYNASSTPTVLDDIQEGYTPGSLWFMSNGDIYVCKDNADGAASWEQLDPAVSTPTLDEVTTEGATTANAITTGAIDATSLSIDDNVQIDYTDGGGILPNKGIITITDGVYGNTTFQISSQEINLGTSRLSNSNGVIAATRLGQSFNGIDGGINFNGEDVLYSSSNTFNIGLPSYPINRAWIDTIAQTGTRVTQAYFTDLTSSNALIDGGTLSLDEVSSSNSDVAGRGQFWVKDTTNTPKFTNDAGTDYDLVTDTYTGDVDITGSLDVDDISLNGSTINRSTSGALRIEGFDFDGITVKSAGAGLTINGGSTSAVSFSNDVSGTIARFIGDGGSGINGLDMSVGSVYIAETGSAFLDQSAKGQLWVKNNTPNSLYFTNDAGNDWQLTDTLASTGLRYTNAYFTNHTTTNAETVDSDRTLKDNITPIESGLSVVNSIEPVSYNWKPRGNVDTEITHYGVIAQQVQPIVPEIVTELDNGKLSVRYSEIIPFLIKAVQEQQAKIEELETRIQNLE